MEHISIVSPQPQNQYFDYLIDPSFQEVNILFVFFKNHDGRTGHYYVNRYLLHYPYSEENSKLIAIDLSRHSTLIQKQFNKLTALEV